MDKLLFLRTCSAAAVDIAMAVGVGCAIAGAWVRRWEAEEAAAARERLRVLNVAAACGLFVGTMGLLLALVAGFSGATSFADFRAALPDVLATTPGRDAEGLVAVAFALAIVGVLWNGSRRLAASAAMRLLCSVLWLVAIAFRAASGHAAENGPWTAAVAWQLVHLLAISVWSGCVLVAAWLMRFVVASERVRMLLASLSRTATVALGGVLLSGVVKTYLALAPAAHLLPLEPWTRTLAVKLAAVGIALACALKNRSLLQLPIWGEAERRQCRLNLGIEGVAMLVILSLSALLGGTAPPGE